MAVRIDPFPAPSLKGLSEASLLFFTEQRISAKGADQEAARQNQDQFG
jgi:hypothetical protein